MPRAWHFSSSHDVRIESFPVIVKKRISSRGRGVYVIRNARQMRRYLLEHNISEFIIEDRIDIQRDIRALVLDHRVIGSVERRVRLKDNHGYAGIGVKVTVGYVIPRDIERRIIEISKRMRSDFCGIDFVEDMDGKIWLLECNVSPQFMALQKTLKIDVSGMLIDFIINRI